MTEHWWRCPWCLLDTPSHLDPALAEADRDQHIASAHTTVYAWGAALLTLRTYTHLEAHQ